MRFRLRLFVADEYKPLRLVSPWLWALVAGAIAAQIAFSYFVVPPPSFRAQNFETPPPEGVLRAAAFGETAVMGKILALRIQAFDNQPGISIPFSELNYEHLGEWLDRSAALDERAEYPHFLMAKIYTAVPDKSRRYAAAEWVRRQFLKRPNERWEWMGHVTHMMQYIVKDEALALEMARELRENTDAGAAPGWARQLEAMFLENRDEFESAAAILENQLTAGEVTEPQEFRFLSQRLEEILRNSYKNGEIGQAEAEKRIRRINDLTEQYLRQFDG